MNWVKVENDVSEYLPDTTETKQGLNLMSEEFITYGTAKVMVTNIPYNEAEKISDEIEAMDDVIMLDFDNTKDHYNNLLICKQEKYQKIFSWDQKLLYQKTNHRRKKKYN